MKIAIVYQIVMKMKIIMSIDRLLMAYEDDDFLDALDEDEFYEEISKLKIYLEENNMIIDSLTFQLAEREKHMKN